MITSASRTSPHIEECTGREVGAPLLHGHIAHVERFPANDRDRERQTIYKQVVPLVEYGNSPGPIRNIGEVESTVRIAGREVEVLCIRIAQADIALGVAIGVVGSAAVQPLIGRAADAHSRDLAGYRVGSAAGCDATCVHCRLATLDDRRIRETNHHVESSRTELLEVGRLA
jgi:hypothetical protein